MDDGNFQNSQPKFGHFRNMNTIHSFVLYLMAASRKVLRAHLVSLTSWFLKVNTKLTKKIK